MVVLQLKAAVLSGRLNACITIYLVCFSGNGADGGLCVGAAGHLTYQCRNFVPGSKSENKEVFVDVSSTSSEDSSPLSDSESETGAFYCSVHGSGCVDRNC